MVKMMFKGYMTTDVNFDIVNEDARSIFDKIRHKYGIRKIDDFTFEEINLGGPHVHYFGCHEAPVTLVVTETLMPAHLEQGDKQAMAMKFDAFYKEIPFGQRGLIGKVKGVEQKIMGMTYGAGYELNFKNAVLAGAGIVVLYVILKGMKAVTSLALYVIVIGAIVYGLHKKGII